MTRGSAPADAGLRAEIINPRNAASSFREPDRRSGPLASASFDERFALDQPSPPSRSLQPPQRLASFDDRFTGAISAATAPVRSVVAGLDTASPRPAAPLVAAAAPAPRVPTRSVVAEAAPKRPPAGQFRLASASDTPLPTAYAPADSLRDSAIKDSLLKDLTSDDAAAKEANPLGDGDTSHTAIYDITAHTVYLPNGQRLEAHSGLGSRMDDPSAVTMRSTGPTPPNVYQLKLREASFHGVRAIRLNPVDDSKMHGRDGILAHPYMLGPNGQSNGCVSFDDYPAFLNAFLRGDVNRLVVVEHLANAPGSKTAADWLSNTLKDIFRR
ncbi:MAG TPA: DUF2778 domain-containing protein [Xanthobacteraceae bacterium]